MIRWVQADRKHKDTYSKYYKQVGEQRSISALGFIPRYPKTGSSGYQGLRIRFKKVLKVCHEI